MNRSAFFQAHETELRALLAGYEGQLLNEVVPFWESRVVDAECGGYYNFFTRDGNLCDTRKPGWFSGRTLYTFSSLYNELYPRENWLAIARHGRRYLGGPVYAGNGRFNYMMSREGDVLEGTVSIFTDHFAVKGLYAYIAACENERSQADVALAETLSEKLFAHVQDPAILAAEGTPPGLQKHAVNFLNLLTAQESRQVFGGRYQAIVDESMRRSLYVFANDQTAAPLEYVGTDGQPVFEGAGRLVDPGHTMESLWFCMAEGMHTGSHTPIERAATVLDWVIERCYDNADGGFFQHTDVENIIPEEKFLTTDYAGLPVAWDDKVWWVQCEGLLALCMSALLSENERQYGYFLKLHEYTDNTFRDRDYGEWYNVLARDGRVKSDHKGTANKGPYHVPRCLLQLVLFLRRYLAGNVPA